MAIEHEFGYERLVALRGQGYFRPEIMHQDVLTEIIEKSRERPVGAKYSSGLDIDNPPEENKGLAICYRCRRMQWVTPQADVSFLHSRTVETGREEPFCPSCINSLVYERFERLRKEEAAARREASKNGS